MPDTTNTDAATLRIERDTARAEVARLNALLTKQAAAHEAATQGYRDQASRDHSDLVTLQLEVDRLTELTAELRHERDQAEQQKDAALQANADHQIALDNAAKLIDLLTAEREEPTLAAAFESANATLDRLAVGVGHDDVLDDDERYFRGPTPANEKFVSAMAALEPDEDEIAQAMELAEREAQSWRNVDDNSTLGLSQGAA